MKSNSEKTIYIFFFFWLYRNANLLTFDRISMWTGIICFAIECIRPTESAGMVGDACIYDMSHNHPIRYIHLSTEQ